MHLLRCPINLFGTTIALLSSVVNSYRISGSLTRNSFSTLSTLTIRIGSVLLAVLFLTSGLNAERRSQKSGKRGKTYASTREEPDKQVPPTPSRQLCKRSMVLIGAMGFVTAIGVLTYINTDSVSSENRTSSGIQKYEAAYKYMDIPVRKSFIDTAHQAFARIDSGDISGGQLALAKLEDNLVHYAAKMKDISIENKLDNNHYFRMATIPFEPSWRIFSAPHMGWNMTFDPVVFQTNLKPEEIQVLLNTKSDPVAAAQVVQILIHQNKSLGIKTENPEQNDDAVDFSQILFENKWSTECRHHAMILFSILKHYGYTGTIRRGWILGYNPSEISGNHVWFEIPEYQVVIDATNLDRPMEKQQYYSTYVSAYLNDGRIEFSSGSKRP